MKNKKLTYFLGFVVVMVWGVIIYRIIDASSGGDDPVPVVSNAPQKEVYNDFAVAKDTTRLLLNYRDPFGLIKQKDTLSLAVKKSYHKSMVSMPQKPVFNWGFIQYSGYIRNPGSKKLITLLSINGKSEMLSEGESRDNVKLIKNLKDSIKISFNGKTKFIAIK
ncbi:MAG: hypothetical protein ACHQIM_18375 [Sphingobacteriales bacterium]